MEKGIAKHDGPYFPTSITNRSKTSTDIILKNPEAFHNTLGPLNSSDHIPIIYKISTAPIYTEINPRLNFRKADWEKFKNMLEIIPEYDLRNRNINEINDLASEWTQQLVQASIASIPITTKIIIPHIKQNNRLKNLQRQHRSLLESIFLLGPSYDRQRSLQSLRNDIKEEYKQLNSKKLNDLIDKTDKERNNKDFWMSVKRMI